MNPAARCRWTGYYHMLDQGPNANAPATALATPRRHWGLVAACVASAVVGLITFLPAIDNEFVYDDIPIVLNNPAVNVHRPGLEPVPWSRVWLEPYWPRFISQDKLYRPLTTLSLRINALVAGDPLRPRPFRVVNLALHVLTCVGVVVLAWRLTGSATAGGMAGMLFAAHPVHTEAVVTIYGRAELLAGCFAAWLLARHVRPLTRDGTQGVQERRSRVALDTRRDARRPRATKSRRASRVARQGRPPAGGRRSVRHILFSSSLLAAAVMSKEHAVFLWPALVAVDLWHRRDRDLPSSRTPVRDWVNNTFAPPHVGFAFAVAAFLFCRYLVFGWKTHLEAERTRIYEVPMAHVGLIEHLLTPFRLLWTVVRNLTWPDSLCPIWSYPALSPADGLYGDVLAGIVVAAALVGAVVVLWWRRDLTGALLAGLLLTLAIPIQAVPVARWFYAERWLYLPTVLMAAPLSRVVRSRGRAATVGGLALALVLLPQSWQYAAKFADNLTMQREVIVRQPDNFQGRRNYASVLFYSGRYPEAIQAANQLVERFGKVSDAYMVLLRSYLELGDGRRALDAIETYEQLRAMIPEPGLSGARLRAEALIAQQRLHPPTSRPSTSPATNAE
ncbi:MAG: hypothetical protein HY718_21330 [Planctomycetes bacterium]|nr:hypothetical protein [Planctomycetota bacterium]